MRRACKVRSTSKFNYGRDETVHDCLQWLRPTTYRLTLKITGLRPGQHPCAKRNLLSTSVLFKFYAYYKFAVGHLFVFIIIVNSDVEASRRTYILLQYFLILFFLVFSNSLAFILSFVRTNLLYCPQKESPGKCPNFWL